MTERLKTLIVDDSPDDAELLAIEMRRAGFDPEWTRVDTARRAKQSQRAAEADLCDRNARFLQHARAAAGTKARSQPSLIVVSGRSAKFRRGGDEGGRPMTTCQHRAWRGSPLAIERAARSRSARSQRGPPPAAASPEKRFGLALEWAPT
jgi:hypothetical protein